MSGAYQDDPSTDACSYGHAIDVLELYENTWWYSNGRHSSEPRRHPVHRAPSRRASLMHRRAFAPTVQTSTGRVNDRPRRPDVAAPSLPLPSAQHRPRNSHQQQQQEEDAQLNRPPSPFSHLAIVAEISNSPTACSSSSGGPPSHTSERARVAAVLQELPGIGTWAGRQRLFTRPAPSLSPSVEQIPPELHEASETDESGAEELDCYRPDGNTTNHEVALTPTPTTHKRTVDVMSSPPSNPRVYSGAEGAVAPAGSVDSVHEAWRWRFCRKWEAEQRRGEFNACLGNSAAEEELDALEYCQAVGMGIGLQVDQPALRQGKLRRRSATSALAMATGGSGHGGGLYRSASETTCQFDVDPSYASRSGLGAEDSSSSFPPNGTPFSGSLAATKEMMSVAGKARELLRRQLEIESAASAQWERPAFVGSPWAGSLIPPVQIDMYGKFLYVVLRVSESAGGIRQKMLLRGRRGASKEALIAEAIAATASLCTQHGFSRPEIELVGLGQMEWREDTERHLVLSPAPMQSSIVAGFAGLIRRRRTAVSGGQKSAGSPPLHGEIEDVSGLAASLVRQALPCHFSVTCHPRIGQVTA